jgi:hypothetical protein
MIFLALPQLSLNYDIVERTCNKKFYFSVIDTECPNAMRIVL